MTFENTVHVLWIIYILFQICKALFETPCILEDINYSGCDKWVNNQPVYPIRRWQGLCKSSSNWKCNEWLWGDRACASSTGWFFLSSNYSCTTTLVSSPRNFCLADTNEQQMTSLSEVTAAVNESGTSANNTIGGMSPLPCWHHPREGIFRSC
jgi:hypothetical protein